MVVVWGFDYSKLLIVFWVEFYKSGSYVGKRVFVWFNGIGF